MNALTDLLEMDIAAWIVGAFLIMAGINKGIEILGNFSKSIGKPFKWVKKRDADHDELEKVKGRIADLEAKHTDDTKALHQEIKDSIDELKKQMKEYSDNRVSDRKQSFAIQKELTEAQDKIAQLYRRYHSTSTIKAIELESLKDLIRTYEEHGGENSFVHSLVEKEMYTWKVVD